LGKREGKGRKLMFKRIEWVIAKEMIYKSLDPRYTGAAAM
jgi:hypothetical protein